MRWQGRSRRKYTGGRLHFLRRKKKHEAGRPAAETTVGEERRRKIRTCGGGLKMRLLRCEFANVGDPRSGTTSRAKIITVKSNPANPFFARRNITTKGAVIETEVGDAVVTSRPGQDGVVNARLI
ncbi:MAG: 30S ribosomal protein S8e [Methanophagales archaeon]|nr:30S ribosomal protein S8e [Methanophagales archaeon]PXF51283.1 MAG: 30S ribosomal protein S8e [Methanophagales archaeon]HDN68214.1 30S ribosomal protein S8e [Methanomicrobia archaeon]